MKEKKKDVWTNWHTQGGKQLHWYADVHEGSAREGSNETLMSAVGELGHHSSGE